MDGWRGLCCTSAANTNWTPSQSATALSRDAASVWRHGLMEDPPQWQRMVHFDCGWFAMALATDMHLHVPPWSCVQSGTMALSMAISPALLEGTDSTCFSPCGASATKSTPRATEFCGLSARFEGRAGHSRPDAGAQRLWCTCFNSGLWLSLLQEGFSESRWWRGAYVSLPWYDFHASVAIWYYGMSSLFAWIPHFWEIESASASQFQLQIASTKSTQFAIARCWGRICREHRPWTQAWWTRSSATRTWPTIAWSSFEGGWALWHWTVCEGHRTSFAKWPTRKSSLTSSRPSPFHGRRVAAHCAPYRQMRLTTMRKLLGMISCSNLSLFLMVFVTPRHGTFYRLTPSRITNRTLKSWNRSWPTRRSWRVLRVQQHSVPIV